jgi:hypothetical protein
MVAVHLGADVQSFSKSAASTNIRDFVSGPAAKARILSSSQYLRAWVAFPHKMQIVYTFNGNNDFLLFLMLQSLFQNWSTKVIYIKRRKNRLLGTPVGTVINI